jgi:fused signal recognition particle receptor
MFGFIKKKLKSSIESISKKIERSEEAEEILEEVEAGPVEKPEKKPSKKKKKFEKPEISPEPEKISREAEIAEELPAKKGFFSRIRKKVSEKQVSESEFEKIFSELEIGLLENNVAFAVIESIKNSLKDDLVDKPISRGKTEEIITNSLIKAFDKVLIEGNPNELLAGKKPVKFLFVGVNGCGKTTSIAKFANWLKKNKMSVVLSASDTFRAASIEQLGKHAEKLNIKMVKHQYKSDAAAVAFDAVSYAKAKNIDVVLIDTAGRSHANTNLMDELKKIHRVIDPDYVVFVADALTGNDAVEQARKFDEVVPINFSILTKADVDQKGGAILSVAYVTEKPILFLGVGQGYDDFEPFDKKKILKRLFE